MSEAKLSTVALQVGWNRLISVVEEQAQALVRTAFSTSVREAGDLSAGVYDPEARMLAQAVTGTPGHVNAMAEAVAHFVTDIGPENIFEGDIYITNDPWKGTGHLHDITVVTPSFRAGRLVGFFACTAHVTDIGGRGFTADANSVYEEGLFIPIMKFAERGEIDRAFVHLLRANVREPDQLVGDVHALATCNDIGHRRLMDMMDEFGMDGLGQLSDFILGNSRRATLARIAELPKGSAEGAMRLDGYDHPIDLKVRLTVGEEDVLCDFAGTSGLDSHGINVPLIYTKAYACYAIKCAIAPDIPNNAASLAPFRIAAEENSIVHALHPAPVAMRHIVGHTIPDTVYDALEKLLPGRLPAPGSGALCNFQLSLRPASEAARRDGARRAEVLCFNSGGSGARPGLDGMNTTAFPSGVMTMPVEASEQAGPVIIWRKEFRPDSGGPGCQRGGLGQHMTVGARDGHVYDMSVMLDRIDHPAPGRAGGGDGAPTQIGLEDGGTLRGKGRQPIPEGVRVVMAFAGGAGHGAAAERDPAAVRRDLALGYISAEAARDVYGLDEAEIGRVLALAAAGDLPGS
ncbi:hydantoinase B/oxoprolinase family protein [Mangrovicoccus sp. HB161399]|uniref:hydantoinase B/oxoprolinase family protein n=1 Tax=Mangrovicoccus sp. HB161399 TaxID=2720392 RepID=UPI001557CCEF|nr:hydantoinase B/oxoprolinase family protein [Mangrovicoccus sp. HB161399]